MINYKNILPIELNYKLKNLEKFMNQKKPEIKIINTRKYVYFLDAPSYGNIGDQAIAYSMEKFMKDYFPDYEQIEFQESNVIYYINWLKQNIKQEDVICLTGGGNMGVMYQKYEALRRIIIKEFPNNTILIFPQTISYDNNRYAIKEFKKSISIYNNHKKLLLMAREEKSYKIMKENYNKCHVVLCPDIVLYLNYKNIKRKKNNTMGICLRNDKEKANIDNIDKLFNQFSKEKKEISTLCESNTINNLSRKSIIEEKLAEIASNELIITDRLHGMIFAYITNTPCIALPNSNGKVEGVYKWIKGKGCVEFVKDNIRNINISHKNNEELKLEFNELYNNIRLFIEKGD